MAQAGPRKYPDSMCASYGLGGGRGPLPLDLKPLDERDNQVLLHEWMQQRDGVAKITGKNARNLNPIIRADGDGRTLELAWWWLWLDSSGPVKYSAFNSRDDKLLRSWRKPFQQRALIPATWYIEKGQRFELDGDTFGIAALTSTVQVDGEELVTYSMVTRQAVGQAATVHDRMPLALPRGMHDEWLDPDRPGDQILVDKALFASEQISRELTIAAPKAADDDKLF